MDPRHITIALLCPSLGLGGSEQQLVTLAVGLHARGHNVHVIVLYGGESLEERLAESGVPVCSLNKKTALGSVSAMLRLQRYIRREHVDVVYSFHGLPNLMAALTHVFHKRVKAVIGVRGTTIDVSRRAWWQRLAYWLEPRLARGADLIIANSYAGQRDAEQRGFPVDKLRVVLNGIDTRRFVRSEELRVKLRRQLLYDGGEIIVGLVARIDPMKGHTIFLEAAAQVHLKRPTVQFLCVWDGDVTEKQRLINISNELGLSDVVFWVRGDREARAFYNAMDVVVSSSRYGEGFSNAIAEAMACGCQCVVTDVGDSAKVVEGIGIVVRPGDPSQLADGILSALAMTPDNGKAAAARQRILTRYSTDAMVDATLKCLSELFGNWPESRQVGEETDGA